MIENFDDIRPYTDQEIPAAMKRITESDAFPLIASWVFPDRDIKEVRQMMLNFRSIHDFQSDDTCQSTGYQSHHYKLHI